MPTKIVDWHMAAEYDGEAVGGETDSITVMMLSVKLNNETVVACQWASNYRSGVAQKSIV